MTSLQDLAESFHSGSISRENFWTSMQERHLQLSEYQKLITETDVRSIEIHEDELRVVTSDGISMCWQPEDLRTAPNVLVNYGTYEPEESLLLLNAAKDAHVVFDIGANAGFYSLRWASHLAPGGVIHAFEPVPSTYSRLARNVALNKLDGIIRVNNFGLGDEAKTVSIFLPDFSGSGAASLKNLHPDEQSAQVEVEIETLDNYFPKTGLDRLDLVKIDVEGAELLVLQGGQATLSRTKPILFLELLRKWSKPFGYHPNDVLEMLGGMGYNGYTIDNGRLVPCDAITDETIQTNFFFAQPDKHADWISAHR